MGTSNTPSLPSGQEVGMSQTYIDGLADDLKAAQNEYTRLSQLATKADSQYQTAKSWASELKDYAGRIDDTYTLVIDLDIYIERLVSHAEKVCKNVDYSGTAVYLLMKCLKCVSEEIEDLKQLIKELLDAIDCLNDPVLDPNVSIMKCLLDLQAKVKIAITASLEAIGKILKLYQYLVSMEYLICKDVTQDGTESSSSAVGLVYDLGELRKILCCEYCGGFHSPAYEDWCPTAEEGDLPNGCCGEKPDKPACIVSIEEYECGNTTGNPLPTPHLCSGGFGSSFYAKLQEECDKAVAMEAYTKCVLAKYDELKQKALARQNAVKAALDAAKAAKARCN